MSVISKKIYYHDTDCGGVVYYANYLKYFEEARTEYMRECGLAIEELAQKGILFVVRRVEVDYKSPGRYADVLSITTQVSEIKNVSLIFLQEIKRNEQLLASAKTKLVCINRDFQPTVIPDDVAGCLR